MFVSSLNSRPEEEEEEEEGRFVVVVLTGRPARSAAMPVLFLLSGPKIDFSKTYEAVKL